MKLPNTVERAMAAACVPASLPEGRVFLVLAPFCWGKAPRLVDAHTNAQRNRVRIYEGKAGWRFILFDAPQDAWVDGMGTIRWDVPEGADPAALAAKEIARFGKFDDN